VVDKIWIRLGGYLRAKLAVMVCVGVMMYAALRLLGVPFAVPLSVIVAFGELVPTLGVTFLASAAIEELKADVIGPRVEGKTLNMDPLITLVAVLCGTTLLGWEGALIAVPFAAMLQVVFEEAIVPWRLSQWEDAETAPAETGGPPGSPPGDPT